MSRQFIDIALGEEVRVLSGPLENFTGIVEDIDTLRAVIFRMDANLMMTDAADSDLTEIASLMRG